MRLRFHEMLKNGVKTAIVPATSECMQKGPKLYAAWPDKGCSPTGCISMAVMREHGLDDARTTDHHFEQAGFHILLQSWGSVAGSRFWEVMQAFHLK